MSSWTRSPPRSRCTSSPLERSRRKAWAPPTPWPRRNPGRSDLAPTPPQQHAGPHAPPRRSACRRQQRRRAPAQRGQYAAGDHGERVGLVLARGQGAVGPLEHADGDAELSRGGPRRRRPPAPPTAAGRTRRRRLAGLVDGGDIGGAAVPAPASRPQAGRPGWSRAGRAHPATNASTGDRRLRPVVAADQRHHALGQVAGADLDAHGHPVSSQSVDPPAEALRRGGVELGPDARGPQLGGQPRRPPRRRRPRPARAPRPPASAPAWVAAAGRCRRRGP